MKFFSSCKRNMGNGELLEKEDLLTDLKFYVHKFNKRPRPENKDRILIISCFSEFGCETIGLMYCIPKLLASNPGAYVICVGWHGREYLYRHLSDEFWEVEEKAMQFRDCANAFSNTSRNIKKLEKMLEAYGNVTQVSRMGYMCVGNTCDICKKFWFAGDVVICPNCYSHSVTKGILADVSYHKKFAVQVPRPSIKKQEMAKKYLKENSVGIFARGRKLYGRNLQPEFYVKLIKFLEDKGYNPIWLGEKQSTLKCPLEHITDFSRMPESRDLELTLALITNLKFTVQFWTASTRLASMMGVPWILFESPDQIVGNGQEGKRIALTTDQNKKKLILAHFCKVYENHDMALSVLNDGIEQIKQDNWDDIVGMVDFEDIVGSMLKKQDEWRGM
jgi:hypothetical protein